MYRIVRHLTRAGREIVRGICSLWYGLGEESRWGSGWWVIVVQLRPLLIREPILGALGERRVAGECGRREGKRFWSDDLATGAIHHKPNLVRSVRLVATMGRERVVLAALATTDEERMDHAEDES